MTLFIKNQDGHGFLEIECRNTMKFCTDVTCMSMLDSTKIQFFLIALHFFLNFLVSGCICPREPFGISAQYWATGTKKLPHVLNGSLDDSEREFHNIPHFSQNNIV